MRVIPFDRGGNRSARWSTKSQAAADLVADCGTTLGQPVIDGHPAIRFLGGREETLRYLHNRWVTYFGVVLDEELQAQRASVIEAAWTAWGRLAHDRPGLVRILTWYHDNSVIRRADERHRQILAAVMVCDSARLPDFASAGLASFAGTLAASS